MISPSQHNRKANPTQEAQHNQGKTSTITKNVTYIGNSAEKLTNLPAIKFHQKSFKNGEISAAQFNKNVHKSLSQAQGKGFTKKQIDDAYSQIRQPEGQVADIAAQFEKRSREQNTPETLLNVDQSKHTASRGAPQSQGTVLSDQSPTEAQNSKTNAKSPVILTNLPAITLLIKSFKAQTITPEQFKQRAEDSLDLFGN